MFDSHNFRNQKVVYIGLPTGEAETVSGVQGHPWLYSDSEAGLAYM